MDQLSQLLNNISQGQYVLWMLALVGLDFLTGVGSAIKTGTFSLDKLSNIFPGNVLKLVLAVGAQALGHAAGGETAAGIIDPATFAVFALTLAKSIADNWKEIAAVTAPPPKPAP